MLDDIFGQEELPNLEIYKAAQRVVKDYMDKNAKKIEWVAEKLGTTKGYLYAQLEPARTDKPLSVDRVIALTELTGDMRIIEEMAKKFGYTLCKPDVQPGKKADAIDLAIKTLQLEALHGELASDVEDAIQDGVVDENEKKRVREKAYRIRKQAAEIEESLK